MNGLYINTSADLYIKMYPVIEVIGEDVTKYNWLVSEVGPWDSIFPKYSEKSDRHENEAYHFISGEQLKKALYDNRMQVMNYGALAAFEKDIKLESILEGGLLKADFYDELWTNPVRMQNEKSKIEIVAVDGTKLQVKSADDGLLDRFEAAYPNAVDLEKYNEGVMRKQAGAPGSKSADAGKGKGGFFSKIFGK